MTTLAKDLEIVFVYVSDIDRSVSFYRDVLGIPLEQDAHDLDWYAARFPSGVRFALHGAHEGAMPQPPGSVIVDFVVDDVDEALRRLEQAGVAIRSVMRERWGSTIEVADPDGHRIQLYAKPA
jgi:lactoylglutathione lyase